MTPSSFCRLLSFLLIVGWAGVALPQEQAKVTCALDADGRAFTFTVPGVMAFRGSFSAAFVRGEQTRELLSTMEGGALPPGQTQALHSAAGKLISPVAQIIEETPFGRASVSEVALRFEKEQIDVLFRFSQVPGVRGFQAQAGLRNTGPSLVRLLSLTPVALEGHVEGKPAEWLVTALDQSVKLGPVVFALDELQAPFKVYEYGGFYRGDGNGFLFGPVGSPTAYLEASIAHKGDGKVDFSVIADMSGVQVRPGETRWGQQAGLFAEPPRTALPRWAAWVAKTHGARTDKHALSGWNSWQFHGRQITGKDVLAEVDVVVKNPDRLRPEVMQIDAGYRDEKDYKRESNDYFPEGMAFYAQRMAVTGTRPGIFLDFWGPPGWSNIVGRIQWAVQGGYTYLKINPSDLVLLPEELVSNTSFEALRKGFARLREVAGEGTYLLYNDNHPDRATVGLVDANRTGMTAGRQSLRRAMTDVLRSYPLNSRWFAVDNDSYYMGTDIANVSEIAGGWPMVRTWMSMVGLSCGAAFTADPWHRESFQPFWRNVEVMTPPARERTEVLDLCTSREWPRLVGHVKRDWGDLTIALLWNPGTTERTVTLDFAKIGLHPAHRYAVWSFWDNRYMGIAKGSWTTLALAASASQHLCFTELDHRLEKPVLIGSRLHIYCGAAEIKCVSQSRGSMEIELTDAGAREGDLFIYSRWQPVWKAAEGCVVAEIASAGENVWRINLVNRQCGAPQRVVLGILLPITRQLWFWALCGVFVASLVFAVWRYIAFARLREQHAVEQERARIARDVHDHLGASLTQIALLSELAQTNFHQPAQARSHVDDIFRFAQALTRSVDQIVWTLNPVNDTLPRFCAFASEFSQDFLQAAGISCRLSLPESWPEIRLSPTLRHHLFLVLKEALSNVLAHAAASTVRLSMSLAGGRLRMVISDDGQGFDMSAVGKTRLGGGQGLQNMRCRLKQLKGKVEIESSPGHGTTVTVEVKVV
jgi:signal transduction histidine kinase